MCSSPFHTSVNILSILILLYCWFTLDSSLFKCSCRTSPIRHPGEKHVLYYLLYKSKIFSGVRRSGCSSSTPSDWCKDPQNLKARTKVVEDIYKEILKKTKLNIVNDPTTYKAFTDLLKTVCHKCMGSGELISLDEAS